MRIVLLNTLIYRSEEKIFFKRLHEKSLEYGIDLRITAPFDLGREFTFLVASPHQYGSALASLNLSGLLSREEVDDVKELASLWGASKDFDRRIIEKLALGYELQLRFLKPACVLLWNKYSYQNRVLDLLAGKLNIPTLTLERSPFPHLLSLDKDGSLCDSRMYCDVLKEVQSEDFFQSIDIVPFQEYEELLLAGDLTWWDQPEVINSQDLKNSIGVPPDKSVILFLGQVNEDIQNFRHNKFFRSNTDSFAGFLAALPKNGQYFVLGKHHPKSKVDASEYRQLLKGDIGLWLENLNINDAFRLADYVVAVNSAGAFEAILRGIPTLTLGRSMYSGMGVFFEWESALDIDATRRFLDVSQDDLKERVSRAQCVLNRFLQLDLYYFGAPEGKSIKGVDELAKRIHEFTGQASGVNDSSPVLIQPNILQYQITTASTLMGRTAFALLDYAIVSKRKLFSFLGRARCRFRFFLRHDN